MALVDHPELVEIVAELEDTPGDLTMIMRCRGAYHGKVVNGQWFVHRCRARQCKRQGHDVYHVWDIRTGEMRTVYDPPVGGEEEDGDELR